ncbi:hypothetical protein M885DRAFT_586072 [Pelagophyceae sp. CCMP2097]|nr:hypothetical protein M885DRAFT_586072 [Pelagophyceae sp. CCMP2097]
MRLLLGLVLLHAAVDLGVGAQDVGAQEAAAAATAAAEQEALQDEAMRDVLAAGRGERDDQGVRDQWVSGAGIGSKTDTKFRAPSKRISEFLRDNMIECPFPCDHRSAVQLVQEYVETKKRNNEREALREKWVPTSKQILAGLASMLAISTALTLYLITGSSGSDRRGDSARDASSPLEKRYPGADLAPRIELRKPPTWRETEEKEVWTLKQLKQFETAVTNYLGVPPKERWPLVAARVDDKTFRECAQHFKLREAVKADEKAVKNDVKADEALENKAA